MNNSTRLKELKATEQPFYQNRLVTIIDDSVKRQRQSILNHHTNGDKTLLHSNTIQPSPTNHADECKWTVGAWFRRLIPGIDYPSRIWHNVLEFWVPNALQFCKCLALQPFDLSVTDGLYKVIPDNSTFSLKKFYLCWLLVHIIMVCMWSDFLVFILIFAL